VNFIIVSNEFDYNAHARISADTRIRASTRSVNGL